MYPTFVTNIDVAIFRLITQFSMSRNKQFFNKKILKQIKLCLEIKTLNDSKESFEIQNPFLLTTCRCFDARFDEFRFNYQISKLTHHSSKVHSKVWHHDRAKSDGWHHECKLLNYFSNKQNMDSKWISSSENADFWIFIYCQYQNICTISSKSLWISSKSKIQHESGRKTKFTPPNFFIKNQNLQKIVKIKKSHPTFKTHENAVVFNEKRLRQPDTQTGYSKTTVIYKLTVIAMGVFSICVNISENFKCWFTYTIAIHNLFFEVPTHRPNKPLRKINSTWWSIKDTSNNCLLNSVILWTKVLTKRSKNVDKISWYIWPMQVKIKDNI